MFNSFLNKLRYLFVGVFFCFLINTSIVNAGDYKYSFNIDGCMQADYIFWYGEKKHDELIDGGCLRSIDFFAKGFVFDKCFNYFLHLNLIDCLYENYFYQGYLGFFYKNFSLKFGQFLLPVGLEQTAFLYDKMFLETSLLNGMGDGKFCGVSLDFHSSYFTFLSSATIPDCQFSFSNKSNLKYLLSFRAFLNFFKRDNLGCHFGVDYKRIKEDQKGIYPFSGISYRDNSCFKSRGSLLNAYESVIITSDIIDLEFLLTFKSLSFQTELGFVDIGWKDFDKEIYSSFYFQFSYVLGGVNRRYDNYNGCVRNPIKYSSYGAVELLFKYCIVDMINYGSLLMGYCQTDGRKESLLFGINWFINDNVKLQLNCVIDDFLYCKHRGFELVGLGFRFQLVY